MAKNEFSFKGFLEGFKTIFSRNAILIIAIYILSKYSNYMKNGFRTFVIVQDAGISKTVLGTMLSFFLLVALLFEAPSGHLCDSVRKKLKYILAAASVMRLVCWLGFILLKNVGVAYVIFFIDGVLYAFMETSIPAILALSVDRKAMGSAYAVMMGLTKVFTASGKATGIGLYNAHGVATAALAAGAIACVGGVLALFLDSEKLANANGGNGWIVKKKASILNGICWKMLPLCLIANMAIVTFTGADNYFPLYATELGYDYLGAITLGNTIQGILDIFIGVLCDIFNPMIIVVIGLLGQVAAPFLWGSATTESLVNLGTLIFYTSRVYGTAIRIVGMKAISSSEQGAFQATFMGAFNLFSIFSATLIGWAIDSFGYRPVWFGLTVWQVVALVGYIVLEMTFLKKIREQTSEEEAV